MGLLIVDSVLEAKEVIHKIDFFFKKEIEVLLYPPVDELPYEISPLSKSIIWERLHLRQRLLSADFCENGPALIVTTIKAINEKIISPQLFVERQFTIQIGETISPQKLARQLEELGYLREGEVSRLGEYAIRGEVLDCYCPITPDPIRVYFFGDEIEDIKTFHPKDHHTFSSLDKVQFFSPSEWSYSRKEKKKMLDQLKIGKTDENIFSRIKETWLFPANDFSFSGIISKLAQSADSLDGDTSSSLKPLASILSYLPLPYRPDSPDKTSPDETDSHFNFLGVTLFLKDPEKLKQSQESLISHFENVYKIKRSHRELVWTLPEKIFHCYESPSDFDGLQVARILKLSTWKHLSREDEVDFGVKPASQFKKKLLEAQTYFQNWLKNTQDSQNSPASIFLLTSNEMAMKKLKEIFHSLSPKLVFDTEELPAKTSSSFSSDRGSEKPQQPRFWILNHHFKDGFVLGNQLFICDYELFGKKPKQVSFSKQSFSEVIENFSDLKENDYVVHINHGIGQYLGLERIKLGDNEKDYLKIGYKGKSKLFVPIEQMNLVQKYRSQTGQRVELDQLGGKSWEKVKKRVRKNLEEITQKLLTLYQKRRDYKVPPCGEDDYFQSEFETAFPFEETEDQLKAIEEIKYDLEQPHPMDRLLCADVGFGKTEVALRAVFKIILSGRQALLLVPTTILSLQHFQNITKRFEDFPVTIEMLNRFKTTTETNSILDRLKLGKIDLLIGTHKVFGKKIQFKKLGLLVIDEEQKFGVKQKERLKERYPHVDTLSLSATPIPRTLHMSLSSIRDVSIISTPPANRIPIKTYVAELEDHTVKEAIENEIGRQGQVFFVENRIRHLPYLKKYIEKLLPEIDIGVAHGQMEGDQLSKILDEFINRKFDLLLSTSIIESGIDLHNVNTLIVNNAEQFGLTQLYQMKGRVGRSERQGYAYFLTAKNKSISEDAMKRLDALNEFDYLGAGFKIAMRDLEIRGPGNVLGAEQSGNIMAIGFELYTKLLNEVIEKMEYQRKLKDESNKEKPSMISEGSKKDLDTSFFLGTLIELKYHGFIPDSYLFDNKEKLLVYKKIASLESFSQMEKLKQALNDRYGKLVPEIERLFQIARIRVLANQIKVFSIKEKTNLIEIEFTESSRVKMEEIIDLIKKNKIDISLSNYQIIHIKINNQPQDDRRLTTFEEKISLILNFLNQIKHDKAI